MNEPLRRRHDGKRLIRFDTRSSGVVACLVRWANRKILSKAVVAYKDESLLGREAVHVLNGMCWLIPLFLARQTVCPLIKSA